MAFNSLSELLNMGGHGLYVWLSYGLTLVAIIFNFIIPKQQYRKTISSLKRRAKRESSSIDSINAPD